MRNYQNPQIISNIEHSLYLIRKTSNITTEFLNSLNYYLGDDCISFERLIKGGESALVVFGPKDLLKNFYSELNLLELEDYIVSQTPKDVWELTLVNPQRMGNLYENIPHLSKNDQFFLQIVLGVSIDQRIFRAGIKAVYISSDTNSNLLHLLQNLSSNLVKMPKKYTDQQILNAYKSRKLGLGEPLLNVDSNQILQLIQI